MSLPCPLLLCLAGDLQGSGVAQWGQLFSQFCTEEWESASLGTPLVGLARLLHSEAPNKQ